MPNAIMSVINKAINFTMSVLGAYLFSLSVSISKKRLTRCGHPAMTYMVTNFF